MFLEFFFFWFLLFCFGELYFSKTNIAYICSIIFSIILFIIIWLFWKEFDLFASVLLAIYSSVFILISLFIVYFSRYWGKVGNGETRYGDVYILDILFLLIIFFISFDFFLLDGFLLVNFKVLVNNYNWIFQIINYDYYEGAMGSGSVTSAVLMHSILYKFYIVEVFVFNLYLLFGLVIAVSLLYFFKLWLNPSLVGHLFAITRFNFSFFFASNFRIRAVNKFKRQVRRKNTSYVKYRVF